jgi:hypothetical protein
VIDSNLGLIELLNSQINVAEEEMVSLKSRYEAAVKDRNLVGIHLLDRNDELCILYERLNIQQSVLSNGEKVLQEREDEIRKLSLVKSELLRKIELEKQLLPKSNSLKTKISKKEIQLENIQKAVTKLSIEMESPENPKNCRHLEGSDPGRKESIEKIQKLELLLAEKEVITRCLNHRKKYWKRI